MKMLGRALRGAAIGVGAIAALFLVLLFYLWLSGRVWYPRQRARVELLQEQPVAQAQENQFALSALDDTLPLNALRMIASHNSYHLEPDWIRRFLIGLAEPQEPPRLRYSHATLWDQLEHGVRSFELDVRARRNRFTITHVPLVDNRGPNPDFALALREIVLWSERRPGHVPVIVLLELKSDWMFLDPGLRNWDADVLNRLDSVIRSAVPAERLLTPSTILRDAPSVTGAINSFGWPDLGDVRDQVLFVMHTHDDLDPLYVARDPALSGRAMFTSQSGGTALATGGTSERPDAAFVIHNNPDPASINSLTSRGLIVRTRADGDGSFTTEQRRAALGSTAQIISTDLPPGHPNDPALGIVEFASGKTLLQSER